MRTVQKRRRLGAEALEDRRMLTQGDGEDDYIDLLSPDACVLEADVPISGQNESIEDVDVFQVAVDAGEVYDFSFVQGNSWSQMELLDESEALLMSRRRFGRASWTATYTGTLYLRVTTERSTPNNYQIQLQREEPNRPDLAQPSDLSKTQIGQLEHTQDVDWFRYAATPGKTYVVSAATLSILDDIDIAIRDANLQLIAEDSDGYWGKAVFATTTDEFFVGLSNRDSATPRYQLNIVEYDSELFEVVPQAGDDALELGVPNSTLPTSRFGIIGALGETQTFRFRAVAGYDYQFETKLGSLSNSQLTIRRDNGEFLAANDDSGEGLASRLPWKATEDGIYQVEVAGVNDFGSYELLHSVVLDDQPDQPNASSAAFVGSHAEGLLGHSGDIDVFRLDVIAGETYWYSIDAQSIYSQTVALKREDGSDVGLSFETQRRFVWQPEESGRYFLEISSGIPAIQRYRIEFRRVVDETPDEFSEDLPLIGFSTIEGRIETSSDRDVFAFRAEAGTLVQLDIDDGQPWGISLRNENGSRANLFNDRSFVATGERQYFEISSFELLDYSFSVNAVEDDYSPTGGPYFLQDEESVSGQFETFADTDTFRVNTTVGNSYRVTSTGGVFSLKTLDGTTVLANQRSLPWKAKEEAYLIEVGYQQETYELELNEVPDDHPDAPVSAMVLASDQEVAGQFEAFGDLDVFLFDVEEGDDVELVFPPGVFFRYRILSEDGETEYATAPAARNWKAPESGRFAVELSSSGIGVDYTLRVITEDDFPDNPGDPNAVVLESGQSVSGRLEVSQDRDVFAFNANAGDDIQIDLLDITDQSMNVSFWLHGEISQSTTRRRLNAEIGETGTYYVSVESRFGERNDYRIQVITEDDHGDSISDNPATLTLNTPLDAAFEVITDVDVFGFDASVGQVYEFQLDPAPNMIAAMQLRSDDGTSLFETSDASARWKATTDGRFFLEARGEPTVSTDRGYQLQIVPVTLPDDHVDVPGQAATTITEAPSLGRHEVWGDRDAFAFEATEQESFRFEAAKVTLLNHPAMRILNVDGETLASGLFGTTFWKATTAGTYYLEVFSGQDVGSYEITKSATIDDIPDELSDGVPQISPSDSDTISAVMNLPIDVDVFRFEALEDEVFSIAVDGLQSSNFTVDILEPDGTVASRSIRSDRWRAPQSGSYFLSISEPTRDFVEYELTFQSILDVHASTLAEATNLELNVDVEGHRETFDDVDMFVFPVEAGEVYHATFEGNGELARQDGRTWSSDLNWKSSFTGLQYMRVDGFRLGPYTMGVEQGTDDFEDFPSDSVPIVSIDTPIVGELEYSEDIDVFRVETTVGQAFELSFAGTGALFEVRTPSGELLGARSIGPLAWKARDPIQYIHVSGSNRGYEFQLSTIAFVDDHPDFIASEIIALDRIEPVTGSIEIPFDHDLFTLDAEIGEIFQFSLFLSSRLDIARQDYVRILDATGQIVAGFDTEIWNWKANETGRYYISVSYPITTDYSLEVDFVGNDAIPDILTDMNPTLLPGTSGTSKFEISGDRDLFALDMEAQQAVFITAKQDFFRPVKISLYGADGVSEIGSQNDQLGRTLFEPGRYYVGFESASDEVGEYRFTVELSDDDHADFPTDSLTRLSPDVVVTGRLEVSNDRDVFQLDATAGTAYQVNVARDSVASNSTLSIVSPNGEVLATRFGSTLQWTAPSSGRYLFELTGSLPVGYEIRLDETTRLSGDLNDDGRFDQQDIDTLFAAIRDESPDLRYDINGDLSVNRDDAVAFQMQQGFLAGDANLSGTVGFDDFLLLSASFGNPGGWSDGDFDGDGMIEFADFLILSSWFGRS